MIGHRPTIAQHRTATALPLYYTGISGVVCGWSISYLSSQGTMTKARIVELIEAGRWDELMHLASFKDDANIRIGHKILIYPIHKAYFHQAPPEVIADLIEAFADALKKTNRKGSILLHVAVNAKASFPVLKLLVDAYPQSIRVKDKIGRRRRPIDIYRLKNRTPDELCKATADLLEGKLSSTASGPPRTVTIAGGTGGVAISRRSLAFEKNAQVTSIEMASCPMEISVLISSASHSFLRVTSTYREGYYYKENWSVIIERVGETEDGNNVVISANSLKPGESTFKAAKGADIREGLNMYAVLEQAKLWGNIP